MEAFICRLRNKSGAGVVEDIAGVAISERQQVGIRQNKNGEAEQFVFTEIGVCWKKVTEDGELVAIGDAPSYEHPEVLEFVDLATDSTIEEALGVVIDGDGDLQADEVETEQEIHA